nr:putative reverse transcriptase domain-containing protein [Tanacetum cinerariifolium]
MEMIKPNRIKAVNVTLQSSIKDKILVAQKEASDESVGLGSWDVHLSLVKFLYNNSYHSSVRCATFEALYGRKCRSTITCVEVGEGKLIGPELVQETTKKISQIKDRLKATRVVRFRKNGKLAPRFVGLFEITKRIDPVAYILRLLKELYGVHDTFYVSNFKKCLADPTLHIPFDEIRVDAKLNFVEEPVEILEREFKKLKRSRIAIVKIRRNSKQGHEFAWEHEDQMKLNFLEDRDNILWTPAWALVCNNWRLCAMFLIWDIAQGLTEDIKFLQNGMQSTTPLVIFTFSMIEKPEIIEKFLTKIGLLVEIDLTWSLRFGFVEPSRLPIPLSSMNLVSDSSKVCLLSGRSDTLFRLQYSIRCLSRRFDTSYPTGGYDVSVDLPEL